MEFLVFRHWVGVVLTCSPQFDTGIGMGKARDGKQRALRDSEALGLGCYIKRTEDCDMTVWVHESDSMDWIKANEAAT